MAPLRYASKVDPFLSLDCVLRPPPFQGIEFYNLATLGEEDFYWEMKGTAAAGKKTRLLGGRATQKEASEAAARFSARKWSIWAILAVAAAACFFFPKQRILELHKPTYEASSLHDDDLTQSIKTAIFHHGAEQPTESHIERTDPCMEKAQLGMPGLSRKGS